LEEKKKGDFTVQQHKKKKEVIEESHHQVVVPPDVGDEEKKALDQTGGDATSACKENFKSTSYFFKSDDLALEKTLKHMFLT
jgi:hypothetical protein